MNNTLKDRLSRTLPQKWQKCILSGTSVTEQGKTVSVSVPGNDAAAVAWRLDSPQCAGGNQQKMCDALFLYTRTNTQQIHVFLVELKGANVKKAIEQIESGFRLFCYDTAGNHHPDPSSGLRHNKRVRGIILATKNSNTFGKAAYQRKRKQLSKQGLYIEIHTGSRMDLTEIVEQT